jgi:type IV fimbrial biogenesis protein FimT
MKRRRRNAGFSLTELMVGVTLTGIVLAATVPNVRSYRESQRMTAAGDQIASAIRDAQARARSQNHDVVVEYRTNTNEFAVIDDVNGNGVADAGEQVTVSPLPDGVTLASTTLTSNQLIFNGRGRSVNSGTVVLSGSHVENREVSVSAGTGRVKVTIPQSTS